MNRRTVLRSLKPLWLIILVAAPVAVAYLPTGAPAWLKAVFGASYLLWLFRLAYDNSERVYFHCNRFLLFITNGQVRWTMSVEMTTDLSPSACDTAFATIRAAWPSAVVWRNDPGDKEVHLPGGGGLLRIRQTSYPTDTNRIEDVLVINLSDLLIPFRASNHTLDLIVSVLESVRQKLQPKSEKYTLKVKFDSVNPYYGLFIRQLRLPNQEIVSFTCDIDQRVGPDKGRVVVNQDRLALTTTNLTTMSLLSRRYITLASLDLSNP